MAGFSPQQREVAQGFTEAPNYAKAPGIARQALLEAGITESDLRAAPAHDGNLDSEGALQQRASQGWGTVAQERTPKEAARMFLERAIPLAGKYGNAGALAQAVQRSEYPARYAEHSKEAGELLSMLSGGRVSPAKAMQAVKGTQTIAGGGEGANAAQLADLQLLLNSSSSAQQAPQVGLAPRQAYAAGPTAPAGYTAPQGIQPAPAPNSAANLLALVDKIGEDSTAQGAHIQTVPGKVPSGTVAPMPTGTANAKGGVGFTPGPGTNYSAGKEPQIASALNTLGRALGLKLQGVSGYRSPQHSVAVGGFADDPHTRGEASDTPGIENVPEAVLNKYGLERPFDKIVNGQHTNPKEADHIQLRGSHR